MPGVSACSASMAAAGTRCQPRKPRRHAACAVSIALLGITTGFAADDKPAPLAIAEQGSSAVGGKVVTAPGTFDPIRHGAYNPTDQSSAGQTLRGDHVYVFYQVPVGARPLPLVMWHGHGQSP